MRRIILLVLVAGLWLGGVLAQPAEDLEFSLDAESKTVPLPKVMKAGADLSGRGFSRQSAWPQGLAAPEVLGIWERDIGFTGIYRLQYNLWELSQIKEKEVKARLLGNYEGIIQKISEAGGIVIVDIFGTPAGLGKALDSKSPPWDLKGFKALIKEQIRTLSCVKRYNVWYELWSAPDLDEFFLGGRQEYLNMYRAIGECINELEEEYRIHIPLGGPSTSAWFQSLDGNNIATAERSMIYDLIKFAARYRLPLDFISWHAYSTDPKAEQAATTYNKSGPALIREWLSYFKLDRNTPLIVDEWNYDTSANVLPERQEKSFIAASYIPARIKNMYASGIDYQTYFSLEDFQGNKEGVVRNVGLFGFEGEYSEYRGFPKSTYNVMRMLSGLGQEMFVSGGDLNNEFVSAIATKGRDYIALLVFNYIDPDIASNYISRNIGTLSASERRILLHIIGSGNFSKLLDKSLDIAKIRATNRVKALLKKAVDLNAQAAGFKDAPRNLRINIKNLKGEYLYSRYTVDSSCSSNCKFQPADEKEISGAEAYQETLSLKPYSVNMLVLRQKSKGPDAEKESP